jgi:hypothetical protein
MAVADVTQTTAASQPLLLAHSGVNYWWGSGVAGNYCSTPSATANQIVGTIEYKVWINSDKWNKEFFLIDNYDYITSTNKGCGLLNTTSGGLNYLVFIYSTDGINSSYVFSDAHSLADNTNYVVKYSGIAGGVGSFWYSIDNGVTYTQIGTNKSHPTTWYNSTLPISIGSSNDGYVLFQGKIYRATISNSIGGTPVVDFNPATYNAAVSQTSWTSSTSEIWTINTGTATTGYKGVLVDRTICQGDGVDDIMISGTLTSKVNFSEFIACNPFQIAAATQIIKDGLNGSVHVFYKQTGAGLYIYNSGTGAGSLQYNGESSNLLQIFNSNYNTASSSTILNNGTPQTGAIGNDASVKFSLFGQTNSTGFANTIINSIIQLNTIASSPQQTATYNVVKTISNL